MTAFSTEIRDDVLLVTFNEASLDDQTQATEIGDKLQRLIPEASGGKILLNFEHVKFMSSVMVGQLFLVNGKCKSESVELKICNVADLIRGVFEIVRLDNFVEILDDEAAALMAFGHDTKLDPDLPAHVNLNEVQKKAEQGDSAAQYKLACCYEEGAGIDQSSYEALNWFCKAAEQGHADAQHRLGTAYAYGIDVSQDYDQAMQWYRKAADQGHAEAQYSLGMSYSYGVAECDDPAAAADWYRKAAAQGHEKAKEELEKIESS